MDSQLMLLLEIQDLHLQKNDLLADPEEDGVEARHFKIELDTAAAALDDKIRELKEELEPAIRNRCDRGFPTLGRMVVPVIGGVCYGCFMSIPTARTGEPNQGVQTCENCGRFIYFLS
jgi:predicted  nucleic acid-binding Zn-ribbon protein